MFKKIVVVMLLVGLWLMVGNAYALTQKEILEQKLAVAQANKEVFLAQQDTAAAQAELATAQAEVNAATTPELINASEKVVSAKAAYEAAKEAVIALGDDVATTVEAAEVVYDAAKKKAADDLAAAQALAKENYDNAIADAAIPLNAAKKKGETDMLAAQTVAADAFQALKAAPAEVKADMSGPISTAQAKIATAKARQATAQKIIDGISTVNKASDLDNQINSLTATIASLPTE